MNVASTKSSLLGQRKPPEYKLDDLFYVAPEGVKISNKWPEFREYALQKYPELDEDLITMIEDLIERRRTSQNDDGK